jgi:lipopolysaccharide heptosyltransferase III
MSRHASAGPSFGRRLEKRAKAFWLPLACRLIAPRESAPPTSDQLRAELTVARRILVIRQDNRLGNMVLITPFLKELRRLVPQAHIAVLVDSRFSDVVAGAHWLDELLIQHRKRMIYRPWEHPKHLYSLRRGNWDFGFDLSNPDSFSSHGALVMAAAGARRRIGFTHPRARHAINVPVQLPEAECHYSLAPLLLLSACGLSPELATMGISKALLPAAAQPDGKIIINPGGRGAKQWPTEKFIPLIEQLIAGKIASPQNIIILGGPSETELLESLQTRFADCPIRCLSRLDDLVTLLHGSALYVGCDAGPLHVAASLGVPTLSLFLTSNPLRYAPLGEHHETIPAGPGSRDWVLKKQFDHSDIKATKTGSFRSYAYDSQFGAQVFNRQPVLTTPPAGMQPPAEVDFVIERIRHLLNK